MGDFEKWFKDQDFYTNMRFIHGDKLFDKDGDVYRILPVQMTYQGWSSQRQRSKDEFVALTQEPTAFRDPSELAMWGRERLNDENQQYTHVSGVDMVIMGHTVTQKPCKRDNCYWIDTGAVHWGTMTILDLSLI